MHVVAVDAVGGVHHYHRHRHVGLVAHGGHNLILVLHLGLHHVPSDADGIDAEIDGLHGLHTRVYIYIIGIGVVLVGGDAQLVVTLRQLDGELSVLARASLFDEGIGDGVAHHNLSIGQVGRLLRVVGVLVGHIDHQRACRLRHRGDVEADGGAVAILAVDAQLSGHGHVELHLVGGCKAQGDGQRVVLIQCGQGVAGQRLDEVGQGKGDAASVAAALVGHLQAVLTALALGHRGDDVPRAGY